MHRSTANRVPRKVCFDECLKTMMLRDFLTLAFSQSVFLEYSPARDFVLFWFVCSRMVRLCFNMKRMTKISEQEFALICRGIDDDRAVICRHNPIGTEEEILLWMLLSCLVSYLNLAEIETPCFNGKPNAQTYREAIFFVLKDRRAEEFAVEQYLTKLAGNGSFEK